MLGCVVSMPTVQVSMLDCVLVDLYAGMGRFHNNRNSIITNRQDGLHVSHDKLI